MTYEAGRMRSARAASSAWSASATIGLVDDTAESVRPVAVGAVPTDDSRGTPASNSRRVHPGMFPDGPLPTAAPEFPSDFDAQLPVVAMLAPQRHNRKVSNIPP